LDLWNDKTDSQANYGLVRYDWTYKPAAVAIKNLFIILSDSTSNFAGGSLDFDFKGNLTNIHWSLLEKKDSSFYIIIWQEVNSFDLQTQKDINNSYVAVNVTLNTNGYTQGQVYRPLYGFLPIQSFNNASGLKNIQLEVPDEVLILRLAKGGG